MRLLIKEVKIFNFTNDFIRRRIRIIKIQTFHPLMLEILRTKFKYYLILLYNLLIFIY